MSAGGGTTELGVQDLGFRVQGLGVRACSLRRKWVSGWIPVPDSISGGA